MLYFRKLSLILAFIATWLAALGCPIHGQALTFLRELPTFQGLSPVAAGDASGFYLAATASTGTLAEGFVRRYDLEGVELWSRRFGAQAYPRSIAIGPAGVYVAGVTEDAFPGQQQTARLDLFVRLYDAQGEEVWTRQFGSAGARYMVLAIAAESSGVYVSVYQENPSGRGEGFLRKYDPRGAELWTRQTALPTSVLAADSSGIYVAGEFVGTRPQNQVIRKYDSRGSELWSRQSRGGILNLIAAASGLFVKSQTLQRFDSNGNPIWEMGGNFEGSVLLADEDGVYVAGSSVEALPGQCASGHGDAVVHRFDSAGKPVWTRQFGTYSGEWVLGMIAGESGPLVFGPGFLAKLEKNSEPHPSTETRIHNECVLNAASYVGGAVAAGEIVTIFGSAIGPEQPVSASFAANRLLGTTLAETRVLFGGLPAPLLYVSAAQTTAIVPQAVASMSSVAVQVEYRGTLSNPVTLPVLRAHPGIFTPNASGTGQAAVVNEDGTLNSASNPARRGSVIAIFGTGGGPTDPALADGQIAGDPPPKLKIPVTVTFEVELTCGNCDCGYTEQAEPLYVGAVAGFAGLMQVNVRVPDAVRQGYWPVTLAFEGSGAPSPRSVRIAVR
jgi:uncharacterized protein (TIGR03437 family)